MEAFMPVVTYEIELSGAERPQLVLVSYEGVFKIKHVLSDEEARQLVESMKNGLKVIAAWQDAFGGEF